MRKTIFYLMLVVVLTVIVILAIVTLGFYRELMMQKADEEIGSKLEAAAMPVKLLIKETGQIIILELEDYVKGVVAAEMPVNFELVALKAQAV